MGFVVDKVLLGQAYLSQYFGFIVCQYHSTNATYSFIRLSQKSYTFQNREHRQNPHLNSLQFSLFLLIILKFYPSTKGKLR